MYLLTLGTQAFHGRWAQFLAGFGQVPWADPRVPGALAVAAVAMALAVALPPRLGRSARPGSALGTLRGRNLLSSALLVAVAVAGLYLGVKLGPPAASLSLILILAPMARGWQVFPREARWRAAIRQL